MTTDPELIGPELARKYLANAVPHLRKPIPPTVRLFARVMKSGKWVTTSNPISFDEEGRLADGAQRLHAVIEAGVEVEFLVLRGLKDPFAELH